MNSEEDVLQEHLMQHRQYGRTRYYFPENESGKISKLLKVSAILFLFLVTLNCSCEQNIRSRIQRRFRGLRSALRRR